LQACIYGDVLQPYHNARVVVVVVVVVVVQLVAQEGNHGDAIPAVQPAVGSVPHPTRGPQLYGHLPVPPSNAPLLTCSFPAIRCSAVMPLDLSSQAWPLPVL
jgi:hypothetical protein